MLNNTPAHPVEGHVVLGHQVGDDDAGGAGEAHVAVDHDQAARSHRAVDKLRGAVEISGEAVCLVSRLVSRYQVLP